MALDVVLPSSIQERPHPRGRRQCSCCPYGYHIDLDFVRYCESITTAQLMPSVAVKRSRWKNVRKKRASREALLGLVTTPQDTVDSMPQRCETPVMASADIGDDLRKAVMDFEKTLRHASLPRMSSKKERNGYDSLDHSDYTPVKAHSNSIYSSVTLPRNFIKSDRDGVTGALPIEEMNFANVNSNNASAETLQNIREQMAASLRRMRELEEHIKVIPRLKEQIGNLRKDNEKLRNELNIKAAKEQQISSDQITFLKKENDSLKKEIEGMEIHRISEDQLEGFRKENEKLRTEIKNLEAKQVQHIRPLTADRITSTNDLVHSRAAAVGCTVLTREVGVSPNIYLTRSIGVGASSPIEPSEPNQSDSISLNKILGTAISFKHKNASVMTDVPYPESQARQIESPKPLKRTEVQSMATSTDLKMGEIVSKSEMSSQLQELKHKMASPPKVSIRVNTILQHDQIFTQNELDERAARFAKTYENNFLSTNLARKSSMVSCAAQTMAKPARKHFGLQAQPKVSDASVVAKPKIIAAAVQAMVLMQEIGVSDDTTNSYACEKCKAKKISVGTLFPDRSDQLLLRINSSPEMKAPKKACISKSTDTRGLRMTKDVSQNTLKKKLVSTSMETGDYTCGKCSSQTPPKPSTVPLPAKRPSYLPISVSRVRTPVTPSPQLQQMLQNEGSNSDSGSDDGTYTIHQDVGASVKDDVFHDQSPKPRSYSPRRDPSKEMKGALKVLNDALQKSPGGDIPKHVKTAVNIVQQEWFKVSSVATANPLDVEYYLDCFEEISGTLLEYVVNMTDVSGNTAMHYAVSNGNFDVVSILLDSKVCNINKLNTAGYTCIMLVALTKVKSETDREVVRRLFNMADVNIRAKEHGQTALMLAVSHGRIDTVELLLEAGADINIQDEDGSTALMCAAEHGYIEIVKLLLAQPDCDLSITDFDGTTALAIAMEAGNRDIGVLLYAQEHFSRGSSPYTSMKHKRSKSTTPTLKSRPTTPSHSSQKKDSEQES